MPHPFQTTLALMSAACALGAVTPAQAHDERAAAEASQGLSAQRVGVDPASRQLRHVTESEARELDSIASTVPATRRQITQTITSRPMSASAARGMRLGAEHLSFTRVARRAGGWPDKRRGGG